jgi:uncharacterized membrane protein YgcG
MRSLPLLARAARCMLRFAPPPARDPAEDTAAPPSDVLRHPAARSLPHHGVPAALHRPARWDCLARRHGPPRLTCGAACRLPLSQYKTCARARHPSLRDAVVNDSGWYRGHRRKRKRWRKSSTRSDGARSRCSAISWQGLRALIEEPPRRRYRRRRRDTSCRSSSSSSSGGGGGGGSSSSSGSGGGSRSSGVVSGASPHRRR